VGLWPIIILVGVTAAFLHNEKTSWPVAFVWAIGMWALVVAVILLT
jgi:hypothetical protein